MQTVKVRTCLLLPGTLPDRVELTADVRTIGDLVRRFGERAGADLTDGTGNVIRQLHVAINGKEVCFYPQGLATLLNPEDEVELYIRPLGGG